MADGFDLLVAPDSWVVDLLLKCALVVRVALSTAPEAQLLAKVITSFTADSALSAGHTDFKSNAVAYLEASDVGPYSHNLARRLVAQG